MALGALSGNAKPGILLLVLRYEFYLEDWAS